MPTGNADGSSRGGWFSFLPPPSPSSSSSSFISPAFHPWTLARTLGADSAWKRSWKSPFPMGRAWDATCRLRPPPPPCTPILSAPPLRKDSGAPKQQNGGVLPQGLPWLRLEQELIPTPPLWIVLGTARGKLGIGKGGGPPMSSAPPGAFISCFGALLGRFGGFLLSRFGAGAFARRYPQLGWGGGPKRGHLQPPPCWGGPQEPWGGARRGHGVPPFTSQPHFGGPPPPVRPPPKCSGPGRGPVSWGGHW